MSTAWTAYPFKRALATAVAARAGITSLTPEVKVISYFPGADEPFADSIILGYGLSDTVEKVALGGKTYDEEVDVLCGVWVIRPGGGQTVAAEAEDRAKLLLSEVDAEIRSGDLSGTTVVPGAQIINPGISLRESLLESWKVADGVYAKRCMLAFTVHYKAKTAP